MSNITDNNKITIMVVVIIVLVIAAIISLAVCLTPAKEIGVYNLKSKYIDSSNFYYSHSPTCTTSTNNTTIYTYLKLKLTIDIDQFIEDENIDINGTLGKTYNIKIDSTSTYGDKSCFRISSYKDKNIVELEKKYKSPESLNNLIVFNDEDLQLLKLKLSKSNCGNYLVELKMKDEFKNEIKN